MKVTDDMLDNIFKEVSLCTPTEQRLIDKLKEYAKQLFIYQALDGTKFFTEDDMNEHNEYLKDLEITIRHQVPIQELRMKYGYECIGTWLIYGGSDSLIKRKHPFLKAVYGSLDEAIKEAAITKGYKAETVGYIEYLNVKTAKNKIIAHIASTSSDNVIGKCSLIFCVVFPCIVLYKYV